MSRREEQLRKIREQKITETVSRIYISSLVDVLCDIVLMDDTKLSKDEIEYILGLLTEKVENLTKGYIDLETYVDSIEEKSGEEAGFGSGLYFPGSAGYYDRAGSTYDLLYIGNGRRYFQEGTKIESKGIYPH